MIALALVCLAAGAAAAPYYHHHHHHGHRPFDRFRQMDDFANDDYFDTARFWQQLETDMLEIEKMMNSFHTHFSVAAASAGVVGDSYKVRMQLAGFEEKEVVVKAREGVLMVQAVHKSEDGSERNYVDIRTLPSNVDANGVWTYSDEILTITFPLKNTSPEPVTEDNVTQAPESREEVGSRGTQDVEDADVGLRPVEKETEIKTNEIPSPKQEVEATTYAVDLKEQYEFVPVHYKK